MKNKVVKNASWIIICKIIQSILSLVVGMFTARYLGPSNFGLINYAASIVTFIAPVMYMGLNSVLVQEIINRPDEEGETIGTSIFMSFISSLLCILGILSFTYIANTGQKDTFIVCMIYSLMLIFQAFDLIQYWFQAKLKSKYTSIIMLLAYAVVTLYKIFLLVMKKGVYWFAISNVIDYFIIAISLLVVYKKVSSQQLKVSFSKVGKLLSKSKYYIISNLMVMVFTQTDKIMLKNMLDDTATGYYSAAVSCASITAFVFSAIIDSMRPSIFQSKKISNEAFELNITRLYSIVIYLSIAQSIGMTLLAKPLILIMYGRNYLMSVTILRLVVWYTTFSYLGSVRGVWMLAVEKQKYLLPINICGALSNVLLNCILIPDLGIMGAALASLITQFFTNVLLGFIIGNIRGNNMLMIRAINPKILTGIIKKIIS